MFEEFRVLVKVGGIEAVVSVLKSYRVLGYRNTELKTIVS
jgi:hypothetical protein